MLFHYTKTPADLIQSRIINFTFYLYQTLPRLLDAPSLENMHVKVVSCGARHTAVITGMTRICILKTFLLLDILCLDSSEASGN